MKTMRTKKGTELPLLNLKGKDYLQVAHRIQWMNEEESNFDVTTNILQITEDYTVVMAKITLFEATTGKIKKVASATKRETKKDFPDHTEKAETGAIGRALAVLGYGTQFALADLDEGNRLADSPLVDANEGRRASFKGSTLTTPPVNGAAGLAGKNGSTNAAKAANGSGSGKTVPTANSEEGWS